ncbi:hypothetical protein ACW0JT_00780 [Arthrobacter sp. SA17]
MSLPDLNHPTALQNRLAPEARTFAVGNWTAELVGTNWPTSRMPAVPHSGPSRE